MFVPTKSSILRQNIGQSCETVVFESKKRKKRTSIEKITENDSGTPASKKSRENLDLKKLRYDIIKFGTSGFDGTKKEESRIALAVALGAKPPKKKSKNYVKVLAEKKSEKEKAAKATRQNLVKPLFKKGQKKKFRNKNESKGLLDKYGKVESK